jgi:hypothetical protein
MFVLAAGKPVTPGGLIIPITTLSTDRLEVLKPTRAADPELDYNAWSPYADDGQALDGLPWWNRFVISDQDGSELYFHNTAKSATEAAAQALAAASMPMIFTGSTEYQFWGYDSPIDDNRDGLSLRVNVYSLVP